MIPEVEEWVKVKAIGVAHGPTLEVGALNINGSIRRFFQEPYTGLDMRAGPGVDCVADILDPKTYSHLKTFKTVVCVETLEHVTEPWEALVRMFHLLEPGGLFIGSWVLAWSLHDEPADYWRVTPAGFAYVLKRAGFTDIQTELGGQPDTHTLATARKP